MNSIFSKLRLFVAATCFTSALSFGGSVSGGGGDTLPPNPIGSAGIVQMLPALRGPIISYFWALEDYESKVPGRSNYSVFFDGPVTIYQVIDSLTIEALTEAPCLDSSGKEVDGSAYTSPLTGICISAFRLGSKLDQVNAFTQTMGLVIHEISHKFGFDEEAASKLQADVVSHISFDNLFEFKDRFQRALANLGDIVKAAGPINPMSDWNLNCMKAREVKRQHDLFDGLRFKSQWTSVIRRSRGTQIRDDAWSILGIEAASCGQADSPLKSQEDDVNFKVYSEAFANADRMTIEDFSRKYTNGSTVQKSNQEILKIDSISSAAIESGNFLKRNRIFFYDLVKLQGQFFVNPRSGN